MRAVSRFRRVAGREARITVRATLRTPQSLAGFITREPVSKLTVQQLGSYVFVLIGPLAGEALASVACASNLPSSFAAEYVRKVSYSFDDTVQTAVTDDTQCRQQ